MNSGGKNTSKVIFMELPANFFTIVIWVLIIGAFFSVIFFLGTPPVEASFPVPNFGVIDLITLPSGADIFIDGVPINETSPASFAVSAGSHILILKKEGFEDFSHSFIISVNETQNHVHTLIAIGSAIVPVIKDAAVPEPSPEEEAATPEPPPEFPFDFIFPPEEEGTPIELISDAECTEIQTFGGKEFWDNDSEIVNFNVCADVAFAHCDLRSSSLLNLDYITPNCCVWNCVPFG